MARGENRHVRQAGNNLTRNEIALADFFHLVAEKLDADVNRIGRSGKNFDDVAPNAERRPHEVHIFPFVLTGNEFAHEFVAIERVAFAHGNGEGEIFFRRAESVNARNGRYDYYVVTLRQTASRAVAEFIDFVVYRKVFFYISIRRGNIRLRLIIIVIGNEVFHSVFGEKLAELVTELRRESFVVRNDERGTLNVLNDVGHGERFSAARYADKHLRAKPVLYSFGEAFYRFRLIARRLIFGT